MEAEGEDEPGRATGWMVGAESWHGFDDGGGGDDHNVFVAVFLSLLPRGRAMGM